MSAKKTAWHPPFTDLLQQRRPRWATVTGEVQLTAEPLRVDDLIEVWADADRDAVDNGETLRGMWRRIRRLALLEYKSVVWPFHHGDLYRLFAYGFVWLFSHQARERLADGTQTERWSPDDLTLVLAVPSINKALRDELAALKLALPASATGYHEVAGAPLPLLITDLGTIAEREDDDFLRWFSGRTPRTVEGQRWVKQHMNDGEAMNLKATPDLEGWDEWVRLYAESFSPEQRLASLSPEQRLASLSPEQRLASLSPEQRLAGLAPEHVVLALPDDALRALSPDYLATLPPDVQAQISARLTH